MKTILIMISAVLLVSCSSKSQTSPSQNKELTNITKASKEKKGGAMQNALDSWLEDDWTPTIEKDEKIKKVNEDKTRGFTLQEYVDKAVAYSKNSDANQTKSHAEEMSELPVIGKQH